MIEKNQLSIILCFLLPILGYTVYAQEIPDHAIGLRLGDGDGFGAEISYQKAMGDNNRLEADLGLESGQNFSGFKLTGVYQWVFPLADRWQWYAGGGAGFGRVSFGSKAKEDVANESGGFFHLAGQAGIEYLFDIPLTLSLDLRPELYFGRFRDGIDTDIALSARYRF